MFDSVTKNRYVLEYSLTLLKEDRAGVCHNSSVLARSNCEISKEEAAKFATFVVENELNELHKTRVKINND